MYKPTTPSSQGKGTQVALPFALHFLKMEMPEQALGGIPLGLGLVVRINILILYYMLCNNLMILLYQQSHLLCLL